MRYSGSSVTATDGVLRGQAVALLDLDQLGVHAEDDVEGFGSSRTAKHRNRRVAVSGIADSLSGRERRTGANAAFVASAWPARVASLS